MQQEVKQTWCRNCGHSEMDHYQWNPNAPEGHRRESAVCGSPMTRAEDISKSFPCGCNNFWSGGKEFRKD